MADYLDGKHWLITLSMLANGEDDYICVSDTDPLESDYFNENILPDLENNFVDNYGYTTQEEPDPDDYASEEEYDIAYSDWRSNFMADVSTTATLITDDNIDNYGENWLNGLEEFEL